jgi:G3E family GTPase
LFALLHDKFILQHPQTDEDDDDDDDDDDEAMDIDDNSEEEDEDEDEEDPLEIPDPEIVLANKRKHPLFAKLFRSKGEFWLSTRPGRAGEWSQAGAMLTLSGGRPWFCTIPASEYETGNKSIDEMVRHDIQAGGRYGDRRQELVFIGEKLDVPGLEAALDACLLNDEEWNVWETVMAKGEGPNAQQAEKQEELMEVFDDG